MLELIAPSDDNNRATASDTPMTHSSSYFFNLEGGSGKLTPKVPPEALPLDAARRLSLALTRSAEVSSDEMCRQLAFRSAGDAMSFDVIRLAYSTLTYYSVSSQLAGTAGIQVVLVVHCS